MMKVKYIWKIMGAGLPELRVIADCFDKAIVEARKVDNSYCCGQVVEKITNSSEPGKR